MTTDTIADDEVKLNIVSNASGLMREQASGFHFDDGRAVAIEDTVAKFTGVGAVYAYPRTQSLVILYSPASCDTAAVLTAISDAWHIPTESVPVRAPTRLRPATSCEESPAAFVGFSAARRRAISRPTPVVAAGAAMGFSSVKRRHQFATATRLPAQHPTTTRHRPPTCAGIGLVI